MGAMVGTLVGSKDFGLDFLLNAAVVAGQVLTRVVTQSGTGEVKDPASTTSVIDMVGIADAAATYNTSPTAEPSNITQVNLVRVLCNPFGIVRFQIMGGTTDGTALAPSTATPANILSNDTADTAAPYATITDTAVGTIDMVGGIVKGRTGNNVGAIRKLITHTNNVSTVVGIGFVNTLAVGDTFIRVPFSRASDNLTLTSNFVNANGIVAFANSGAAFRVVRVIIDEQRDLAWVDAVSADHLYNADSA